MLHLIFYLLLSLTSIQGNLQNSIEYNKYIIEYGSIEDAAVINIINVDTTIQKLILFSEKDYNTIDYVAIINDECFIAAYYSYNQNPDELPKEHMVMLIKYSYQGKELGRLILSDFPKKYHNHSGYMVMLYDDSIRYINQDMEVMDQLELSNNYIDEYYSYHQGDAYIDGLLVEKISFDYPGNYQIEIVDGDYSYNHDITIEPLVTLTGDFENGYFINTVKINSKGELYLNNEPYQVLDEITIPGNYHLVILGNNDFVYEKDFIIYPQITYFNGIETGLLRENMIFNTYVRLFSNAISISMDGEMYESENIYDIGQHIITIYGVNQMRFDIPFFINPSVHLERISEREVHLTIFGTGLLNGMLVSESVIVDEPGDYKFELLMEEQVIETLYFTIDNIYTSPQNEPFLDDILSYVFIVIVVIGGYFILRKK